MKKILFAALLLPFLFSMTAFAKEEKKSEMSGMSMDNAMGMPMSGMEKKCSSMMVKAQMVATDEGGVFVLAGNKLMKYDADLNLVKEVEVKMPMSSMGDKQCPMMGKMKEKSVIPGASEPQEKTV